jgi:hypothetical protein
MLKPGKGGLLRREPPSSSTQIPATVPSSTLGIHSSAPVTRGLSPISPLQPLIPSPTKESKATKNIRALQSEVVKLSRRHEALEDGSMVAALRDAVIQLLLLLLLFFFLKIISS